MKPQPRPIKSCIHLLAIIASIGILWGRIMPCESYAEEIEPVVSSNAWSSDFSGARSESALTTDGSGNLQRVEWVDNKLIVETYQYNDAYHIIAQETIDSSTYTPSILADGNEVRWGGFFGGSDANYIITGQYNPKEDDSLPVLRVTKYSKKWSYLANCEYRDINTVLPFFLGNCSTVEVDGKLYIKTSHQMYTTLDDGLRHQASMSFCINEADMKSIHRQTWIGVGDGDGYVSHSFDQRLAVLGTSVYSSDLGDAYPRAVVVQSLMSSTNRRSINVVDIKGEGGDNTTYTTVGGIATSQESNTVLTVGTQRDQEKVYTASGTRTRYPRNAWLTIANADLNNSKRIELTNYAENSPENATNPQIVKVADDEFLILWGISPVTSSPTMDGKTHTVAYVFVNGGGDIIKGVQTFDGSLSDCQPIVTNGKVIWYVTGLSQNNTQDNGGPQIPTFYAIDIATQTMVPSGNSSYLANATFTITGYSIYAGKATYTGRAINPNVTIRFGGDKLTESIDYSIAFSNNTNAGLATITVTGLGRYNGQRVNRDFVIERRPLEKCWFWWNHNMFYTGSEQHLVRCIYSDYEKSDPVLLFEGRDYTATYINNINAGTASYTIEGKGNYIGKSEGTFEIQKSDLTVRKPYINSIGYAYTGYPIIPEVSFYGHTLDPSQYTITCINNVNVGTATATITGTGENMTGTVDVDFKIYQSSLNSATVSPIPDQQYTGSRITPSPTVTLDGRTLIPGTDYDIEYYDTVGPTNYARAIIQGKNNYTGWTTAYFHIVRGDDSPSSNNAPSGDSSSPNDSAPFTSGGSHRSSAGYSIVMWRLYNPNSGEHFYTRSNSERDNVIAAGWNFEGEGWHAPPSGDPVYRLYNSNGGEHHYTLSASERDSLVAAGWSYEGIGWYSSTDHEVPLFREYNPNQYSCNHNYTTKKSEHDNLVSLGWRDEGVGWYGV